MFVVAELVDHALQHWVVWSVVSEVVPWQLQVVVAVGVVAALPRARRRRVVDVVPTTSTITMEKQQRRWWMTWWSVW